MEPYGPTTQEIHEMAEADLMVVIFALLASYMPIHAGYKKGPGYLLGAVAAVGGIWFLYFNVPIAHEIITIIFSLVMLVAILFKIFELFFY